MTKNKKSAVICLVAFALVLTAVSVLFEGVTADSPADTVLANTKNVLPLAAGTDTVLIESADLLDTDSSEATSATTREQTENVSKLAEIYPAANKPVFVEDETTTTTTTTTASTTKKTTTTKLTTTTAKVTTTAKPTTTTTAAATTATTAATAATTATTAATTAATAAPKDGSVSVLGSATVVPVSATEYEMLCYVVQGEAGGTSDEQLRAVAGVILNRVKSSKFPNTVKGVLTAKNQFSTIKNYYNKRRPASEKTKKAIADVFCGKVPDNSQGALYFYSARNGIKTGSWFETKLTFLYQLGTDRFFK